MADPYVKLSNKTDGIEHTKRSPLTLSAREAKKLNVVDCIAKNRSDLLDQLGCFHNMFSFSLFFLLYTKKRLRT